MSHVPDNIPHQTPRLRPSSLYGMWLSLFRPRDALERFEIDSIALSNKIMEFDADIGGIEQLQTCADKQFEFETNNVHRLDDRRSALLTVALAFLAATPTIMKAIVGDDWQYMIAPTLAALLTAFLALRSRMTSSVFSAMDIATWIEERPERFTRDFVRRGRLAGTCDSARGQQALGDLVGAQVNAVVMALFGTAAVMAITVVIRAYWNQ